MNQIFFSQEQYGRLKELGATDKILEMTFSDLTDRNQTFQKEEHLLATISRKLLSEAIADDPLPLVEKLTGIVSKTLRQAGLFQVSTPIIMSRARLAKMGLENDPLFVEQVFWLDSKRCLRPMLAPHLYEFMLDLSKLRERPFGFFEVGPCFRKESQGARHANEFTMLNLVEIGLPLEDRNEHLSQFTSLIMNTVGLSGWRFETVTSGVYGETLDVVSEEGLELASSSQGPHLLDKAWGFNDTWIGLGLGMERLAMALLKTDQMSMVGRSLTRLYGIPLKL
jgi:phenylalanyl-tRNA synthetase alpha chain